MKQAVENLRKKIGTSEPKAAVPEAISLASRSKAHARLALKTLKGST